MTGFFMVLHALVSILLLVIILMQSGRGGGLTEGFASAESMFGAQTNEFMIKMTTVFSMLFLITCLGLAVLSAQKGKSLMSGKIATESQPVPAGQTIDSVFEDIVIEGEASVDEVTDAVTGAADELEAALDALPEDVPAVTVPQSN